MKNKLVLTAFLALINFIPVLASVKTHQYGTLKFYTPKIGLQLSGKNLMLTTDEANNWSTILTTTASSFNDVAFGDATTLFVAVGDSLMKSTNQGQTWTKCFSKRITNLSVLDPNKVYAVDKDSLYISVDGGNTWIAKKTKYTNNSKVDVFNTGEIYVSNGYSNFVRSTDNGDTWTKINDDYYQDVHFVNATTIILVEYDKVWRSQDSGNTWSQANFQNLGTNEQVYDVTGYGGKYVVGVCSTEVYMKTVCSRDGGLNWVTTSHTDSLQYVSSVLMTDDNRVWIYGGKTWSSTDMNGYELVNEIGCFPNITVGNSTLISSQLQVFPNPSSDIVRLNGSVGPTRIVDLNGKEVLVTERNEINVSVLPSGIYFLVNNDQVVKLVVE